MPMTHQRLARAVAVTTLCGAGLLTAHSLPAHAASATRLYVSAKFGYRISYPVSWKRQSQAHMDLFVLAPDQNAFVSVAVQSATPSATRIKNLERELITAAGAPQGGIHFDTHVINKVSFQAATATIKASGSLRITFLTLDTVRGRRNFLITTAVVLKTATTTQETAQLSYSLASLTMAATK